MSRPLDHLPRTAGIFGSLILSCAMTAAESPEGSVSSRYVVLDRKAASKLLVNQLKPEYPPVAKVNFIQGHVRLQVVVSQQGRVTEAHVLRGHPFLAASALRTIKRWVYRPFLIGAIPTAFQTFVEVNFALRPRKIEELPAQPERDLKQRVQPPTVLEKPTGQLSEGSVRMRLLVSDDGQVMDSKLLMGPPAGYEEARKDIGHWRFRPARWGTLSVPWYLDVDVPVQDAALSDGSDDPGGN